MTPEETAMTGEVIKVLNGWLEKLLGPAAEQVGGMLGDWLQDKRQIMQYNRRKVGEKVRAIMIGKCVTPKELSSKILIPILEGVSLEDDDALQNMWANLIVNYVDSNKNLSISVYPNILRQLSSNEVKILNYFEEPFYSTRLNTKFLRCGDLIFTQEEINNLERLSLIEEETELEYHMGETRVGSITTKVDRVQKGVHVLTSFGKDFIIACRR